jgi:archaellum component FlaF (FlaF/FlaG flagellin family)
VDRMEDIIEQTAVPKTTTEMCGLDSSTQVPNNTYGWGRINALAAVQQAVAERPNLRVTRIELVGNGERSQSNRFQEKDTVTITATVANAGATPAGPSKTEFLLDGTRVLGLADTGSIAPGASEEVSIVWNTRHEANGDHQIRVTADRDGQVAESNEGDNTRTAALTILGNKVRNGSFEDDVDGNGAPDGWSGQSTGAGSASYSDGGSDGQKSASTSGNGGNAAAHGSPSWTSEPIAVTSGTPMDLQVSVLAGGASSPAAAGLVYLGPLGNVVGSVTLLTSPLVSGSFTTLEQSVTIPAGVAQVRVALTGFAATDLATAGTVTFDGVGLFER